MPYVKPAATYAKTASVSEKNGNNMRKVIDFKDTLDRGIYNITIKNNDGSIEKWLNCQPDLYTLTRWVDKCEIKWFKIELRNN